MREAVLDVGSNTAHLLVVDAYRGAAPLPASSRKETLRLAEHLTAGGALAEAGVDALISFIGGALTEAENQGCESVTAFATSAIREATNTDKVLSLVRKKTGITLTVLSGEDEARLTFLAVRRWFGWSSGRLAVFDIGGGSLEIAAGVDEEPAVALSVPLGAGRLTRDWFSDDPPPGKEVKALRKHIRGEIGRLAGQATGAGHPDRAVATSKTFRQLARILGAAPSSYGNDVRRTLSHTDLIDWLPKLAKLTSAQRATLPGVSVGRAPQLLAGALVADAAMDLLGVSELEICPWALREGLILRELDAMVAAGRFNGSP
ncbi:MAG: Ppx/GppA family phosphatase [Nocardioidaceae bacterium]|nr:Ppx/GppA family phosphatase [Nocardioidaceae bacterium]